jgi:hypothetical protein
MNLEQMLMGLEDDEHVSFSMNPHSPAVRAVIRKGSDIAFTKRQFNVSLKAMQNGGPSLLCMELEHALTIVRKDAKTK